MFKKNLAGHVKSRKASGCVYLYSKFSSILFSSFLHGVRVINATWAKSVSGNFCVIEVM